MIKTLLYLAMIMPGINLAIWLQSYFTIWEILIHDNNIYYNSSFCHFFLSNSFCNPLCMQIGKNAGIYTEKPAPSLLLKQH